LNRQQAIYLVTFLVLTASPVHAAATIWASQPKPKFPEAALRKGSEGYVIVRTYIAHDGAVTRATISRSSGELTLDEAAKTALLKWRMNPAAIKPEYLTKGYEQRIDFRQEAPIAARYRDRAGYFGSFRSAKIWTYAPFPEYPAHERLVKAEGVVMVRIEIGADGAVSSAEIVGSSGYPNLDKSAVAAVRTWHTHREYAGKHGVLPVIFTLHSIRR
jgi:TonB family protein